MEEGLCCVATCFELKHYLLEGERGGSYMTTENKAQEAYKRCEVYKLLPAHMKAVRKSWGKGASFLWGCLEVVEGQAFR